MKKDTTPEPAEPPLNFAFAALSGLFLFLVIIKLGDPVIISNEMLAPTSLQGAILEPWPTFWGYWLIVPMVLLGLPLARWKSGNFVWPILLPLVWLLWEFISAAHTVDGPLTALTLRHFTACVALFYLGFFGLNGNRWPWPVFAGIALALCWIIRSGFEQHFGGLAATRDYVHSVYGDSWNVIAQKNPDFAKRINSERIFSTFVYPNALAGGILFFLPLTLVFMWELTPKVSFKGRVAFLVILGGAGLANLYWSGSKAGWLIAVVMAVVAAMACFRDRLSLRCRIAIVSVFVLVALVGFGIRFNRYFARGATSVSARFDYWKAACQTVASHPAVGTGPGTFSRPYARLKSPDSEMARLCHNDYLEQATNSGILGMIIFCSFIIASIYQLYRYSFARSPRNYPIFAAVALGIFGLCVHCFVEYHLYIPALAWPLFFLFGWVWSLPQSFFKVNDKA